jgi:REP element-mobilizing transposase RayT
VDGAWNHVTARGIDRRVIFTETAEYRHFQDLLSEMVERFLVRIHAYVLMPNHFHLVLETPGRNLSAAMQWLKTSYSMWFNRRNGRVGPLFQGRFNAQLFEPHEAGWAVTRYVHLNPVRIKGWGLDKQGRQLEAIGTAPDAATVQKRIQYLRGYRWSSYPTYLGISNAEVPVQVDDVWKLGGAKGVQKQKQVYQQFVEDPISRGFVERPWDHLVGGLVLGQDLLKRIAKSIKGDRREQPGMRRLSVHPTFQQVVDAMETIKSEPWSHFVNRVGDSSRDVVLEVARRRCGLTLKALGEAAGGLDYRCVATAIRRIRKHALKDHELRSQIQQVEARVTYVKT